MPSAKSLQNHIDATPISFLHALQKAQKDAMKAGASFEGTTAVLMAYAKSTWHECFAGENDDAINQIEGIQDFKAAAKKLNPAYAA